MRPGKLTARDLAAALAAAGGIASPAELIERLHISQPTLSRLTRETGSGITAIGRGKATRYALLRDIHGTSSNFAVYQVAADGKIARHGDLLALHGGRMLMRRFDGLETLHDSLPWFIDDMRPQGFLGRLFARQAARLGVPADPREWSADDTLFALSQMGENCVGNLILGDIALARHLHVDVQAARPVTRGDYPALALATLAGELPGSSAGGEQPKFACTTTDTQGQQRHVIVKFSPPAADSPAGRRWADLLICEHLALNILVAAGWPAAKSELLEAGGRVMIEVERFDRTAEGRIGIVSGAAIEAEYVGGATTWSTLGTALGDMGRLAPEDAERLVCLELFGGMIGNSDMHLGNISFFTEDRFALAPSYDMLPMRYAPVGRGELLPDATAPSIPAVSWQNRHPWRNAAVLAKRFWERIRTDPGMGGRMNDIASVALTSLAQACTACERLK